jgi:S-adenosyl-L-methionine hydrolase (adenosine-forming)
MVAAFDTVSFLSDYGHADEFVGVVKGVIRDLARHVTVIDLSHDIPPHDVRAGSLTLARAIQYVPSGVVLAVVDPGVGTDRRAVAVAVAGGRGVLVGPDNGLLAPAVAMAGGAEQAVALTRPDYHLGEPSATFHGRDVFAPVAAHLCNGVPLDVVGVPVDPATLLPGVVPLPREESGALVCEILWVDRFGNAQLNVGPDDLSALGAHIRLEWDGGQQTRVATRATTYDEITPGAVGLVIDSYGLWSVCLARRSAAAELGLGAGDLITLSGVDESPASPAAVTLHSRR